MERDEAHIFDRIAQLFEGARTVAVCGHTDPDGDALGSVLAMTAILESRWPHLAVQPLLANDRPLDETYRFLPGSQRLVPAARYDGRPDVFVAVDTPTPSRLADGEAVLRRAARTAAFDHHPTMEAFADVCFLRESAASVGDIVCDFMAHLGVAPTPDVATCILCAVMTDTGRFQYQNTDAHALRTAAAMVEAGASPSAVATRVYQSFSLSALRLKEAVLGRLATAGAGCVAYSYVTQGDLERCGASAGDCDCLIDEVRSLAGPDACLFMRELPDGSMRGNLRAKSPGVDVSAVAAVFGGGGHRAAAGFTVEGPVERAVPRAVETLVAALGAPGAR